MILLAHPTGNQFVRQLLAKLQAEQSLGLFATTLGFPESSRWPGRLSRDLARRCYPVPSERLWTQPWRETVRLLAGKAGAHRLVRHETGWASVDAVYRHLDHRVAAKLEGWGKQFELDVVYGYEDGCAETLAEAQRLRLRRVYDLPIAYWETSRRWLDEEAVRWPAWEPTLGGTSDSPAKLARKTRELELAEIVVCPSRFVVESLPAWARDSKKIVLAPFGSPEIEIQESRFKSEEQEARHQELLAPSSKLQTPNSSAKLRVLFAGSMSQRKGLADVFAAMRLLGRTDIELVVMGTPVVPMEFYRREYADFIHEPTRPHAEVLRLMRSCDVLVLPSIVEGRALVMQEAMSQGLPIIITPNTGGADLIDEGRTGFLVPVRSPDKIAEKIAWCAEHRAEVRAMDTAVRAKAAAYTWAGYARIIVGTITETSGQG